MLTEMGQARARAMVACLYRQHVQRVYEQFPTPEGKECFEFALRTEEKLRAVLNDLEASSLSLSG